LKVVEESKTRIIAESIQDDAKSGIQEITKARIVCHISKDLWPEIKKAFARNHYAMKKEIALLIIEEITEAL